MPDGHLWNANFLAQNAINVSLCKGSASVELFMMISTQLITVAVFKRKCKNRLFQKYLVVDHYYTEKSILCVTKDVYLCYTITFEYECIFHYIISIVVTIV